MSRPLPSGTLEAAVRAHFGLSQEELGRYLGLTRAQVAHLEAGRRRATPQADARLRLLARLLPPPEGTGPVAPAFAARPPAEAPALLLPDFGPLPAAPLRRRQRQVLAQAARLRWTLHRGSKGLALQQRRAWGLAELRAALPPPTADAAEQAHCARWLATLAADVAALAPTPAAAAARALAVLRLLALDGESAALARLLEKG
ncbi:helix-turn-helix domain-containing protein [Hymenobacter rubripertinctus]|uniref:XRE family transcriptional regulator n=1 Tax=Hymenobacter rubripertinctus TaxID=2029981 RepID=A0A418QXF1_9BACT|nr:helix-turn-helix transcriptional regulator [Hymenobacter rubripertinctus]RIY09819.1 XRE family transcriptional regulator [Hymenobacter rubripertinctus]